MCDHELAAVVLVPTEQGYQLRCLRCGLLGVERRGALDKARAVLQRLIYNEEVMASRPQDFREGNGKRSNVYPV
jgi:hypothetical protein